MFNFKGIVKERVVNSGTSKAGNAYTAGNFVIDMHDNDKTVEVSMKAFGDLCEKLQIGSGIEGGFVINSRRWTNPQGVEKLFNDLTILVANVVNQAPPVQSNPNDLSTYAANVPQASASATSQTSPYDFGDDKDDLPF